VLAIAVDALGADKVRAVMMPSPYTAEISWVDARDMAKRMQVRYDEVSIVPEFEAFWRRSNLISKALLWIPRKKISKPVSEARC